jgi:hypothetical protein
MSFACRRKQRRIDKAAGLSGVAVSCFRSGRWTGEDWYGRFTEDGVDVCTALFKLTWQLFSKGNGLNVFWNGRLVERDWSVIWWSLKKICTSSGIVCLCALVDSFSKSCPRCACEVCGSLETVLCMMPQYVSWFSAGIFLILGVHRFCRRRFRLLACSLVKITSKLT